MLAGLELDGLGLLGDVAYFESGTSLSFLKMKLKLISMIDILFYFENSFCSMKKTCASFSIGKIKFDFAKNF